MSYRVNIDDALPICTNNNIYNPKDNLINYTSKFNIWKNTSECMLIGVACTYIYIYVSCVCVYTDTMQLCLAIIEVTSDQRCLLLFKVTWRRFLCYIDSTFHHHSFSFFAANKPWENDI